MIQVYEFSDTHVDRLVRNDPRRDRPNAKWRSAVHSQMLAYLICNAMTLASVGGFSELEKISTTINFRIELLLPRVSVQVPDAHGIAFFM